MRIPDRRSTFLLLLLTFAIASAVFAKTAYSAPDISEPSATHNLPPDPVTPLQPDPANPDSVKLPDSPEPEKARYEIAPVTGGSASANPGGKIRPLHDWETGEGKSYLIPALEVPGFVVLLNVFDRLAFPNKRKEGRRAYNSTPSTTWEHLREQNWHFDKDRFDVNQFGHPYEGATMFGLARSTGVGFWPSLVYANAGSFLWEMAGETSRPSWNDLITTGNSGSLFGEALFRMANLVLEDGGSNPDGWHKLVATVASPPTGFNRWVFGERFDSVFPSRNPARFWRLNIAAAADTHYTNQGDDIEHHDADLMGSFSMAYGLPGKPGYTYTRPFDYFDFNFSIRARFNTILDALNIRGLLAGTDYHIGDNYRGIWGLYGSFDYLGPYVYRASSTALSLGTTGQYWAAPGVAVQGTLLGGFGFGAAGNDTITPEQRGYHYGGTPQGLLALNVIFGDRTMLDLGGRAYYVTKLVSDHNLGPDLILRGQAGVTVRVTGKHAVALQYTESVRHTYYDNEPHRKFSEGTVSLMYTFLNDVNFGAVSWDNTAGR